MSFESARKGTLNEVEMNRQFVDIWDTEIIIRLENGEINSEMDIQAIYRVEMEKRGMISSDNKDNKLWGCYYNLLLSEPPNRLLFDLALMKYEGTGDYKKHYPAIVAEFKIWKPGVEWFYEDYKKLNKFLNEEYPRGYRNQKPYACHIMSIIYISSPKLKSEWREIEPYIKRDQNWKFEIKPLDNVKGIMELKTYKCQWGRYNGENMPWCQEKGFNKNRELWRITATKIRDD